MSLRTASILAGLGAILAGDAVLAQEAPVEPNFTVEWRCQMRDLRNRPFTIAGRIDNFPASGEGPLHGEGMVTQDSSRRFAGAQSVWQGTKQFDFSLFGETGDGRKSLITLQVPRTEYAANGAGSVAIVTPDDPRHGGRSYSEYVGSGFCSSRWTDNAGHKAPMAEKAM